MTNLTIDDILHIHELVSQRFIMPPTLRDTSVLQAAVNTWNAQAYGTATYGTIYEKAAALARGIICDRPFEQGNRRTAMLSALTLLKQNDVTVSLAPNELHEFASNIAVHRYGVPAIAVWFESHAVAPVKN